MDKRESIKALFTINKRSAAAAAAAAAAMIIVMALAISGGGADSGSIGFILVLAVCGAVFVLVNASFGRVITGILYLVLPGASFVALENFTHVISETENMTLPIILLNLVFFYLLYAFLAFLTGSVKRGFCIATLVPMVFGLADYYVMSFRSAPIVAWDFLSFGTAMSVANNYSYTLEWKAAFVLIGFIWIMLLASKSSVRFERKLRRFGAAAFSAVLLFLYVIGVQKVFTIEVNGGYTVFNMANMYLFNTKALFRDNGIAVSFLGSMSFLHIDEPDGYSVEKVEELQASLSETASEAVDSSSEDMPNVIVIMNEAFSDLSVWGDFATSEEVMPFFRSIQEEAVGGEVYVSVKGGNTANTEFEFLTGDTMGFLPAGSIPYQQYINGSMPSLVSWLSGLGYDTEAIHPYNRTGWDRDEVYEFFGFDEFLDLTDFVNPIKYRGYTSDQSAFEKIIELFEQKEEDSRMFVFEVTMQNHSSYSKDNPDFDIYLKLTEAESETTSVLATEKYLTLMNMSDRALQELTEYFEEQDEPVIILMFGDHQPSDYITNVIQRLCGVESEDTLEFLQQGYRVPFAIWSNYGLEHAYYDGISVNYLSTVLLEAAGIPLNDYQKYLSGLMETLPVINGNAYRDSEGTFYSYGDDAYTDLLNEYQILQYNHLHDTKNRVNSFFGG